MRKTKAQKIKTEQRKAKNKIKEEISAIEKEIADLDQEIIKAGKKENRLGRLSGFLKSTAIVSLVCGGVSLLTVLIGCGFAINNFSNEEKEVDAIVSTEEYQGFKKEMVGKYVAEYEGGKISSGELSEKIENLDSAEFVKENHSTEKLDKISKDGEDILNTVIGAQVGVILSYGVLGGTFVGDKIAMKKEDNAYEHKSKLDRNKFNLEYKKKRKETELDAIEL